MNPIRLECNFKTAPVALEAAADGSFVSDDMLAAINAYPGMVTPRTRENCIVRSMWGLSDEPWRDGIYQVTADELQNIAQLAVYEPILFNHDRGYSAPGKLAMPTGRIFRAVVTRRPDSEAQWIRLDWWTVNTQAMRDQTETIDGGVISEVSTGFQCEWIACSICGEHLGECDHRLLGTYDGKVCRGNPRGILEVDEWSLVWKGRVRGTRLGLAASIDAETDPALKQILARATRPAESEEKSDPLSALFSKGEPQPTPLASLFG